MSTDAQQAGGTRMAVVRSFRPVAALALLPWIASPALAAAVPIEKEPRWVLSFRFFTTGPDAGTAREATVAATPSRPGSASVKIPWYRGEAEVRIDARFAAVGSGDDLDRLALEFTARPAGDPDPVRTSRDVEMSESASHLVEILREGDRSVVAAVRGERSWAPVIAAPEPVGPPVVLGLAVSRVDGDRVVPLESNELHTFLRDSVEYSFRRGTGDEEESLLLVLTPLASTGDVLDLRVQVSGRLPGDGAPVLLSRDLRVATSRGAVSKVDVLAGAPPSGYRFSLTPNF